MNNSLKKKDYFYIGSLVFGMMFGAANLIFPVSMGQQAGSNVWLATAGFLISAVGLPFLGLVAVGISETRSVFEMAMPVGRKFSMAFTLLLYLSIGPFFAIPRLATTSFQIGIVPFLSEGQQTLSLAIYSVLFFALAWKLAQNPSKLLNYIGKILNPIFLVVLGLLLAMVVIKPMGDISQVAVTEAYQANPVVKGILDGYGTLDVLASLAFGIAVITSIQTLGVTKPAQIVKDTMKSGIVSVILMSLIYVLLAYAGATSMGQFAQAENGGIVLAQIANYYLGTAGSVLLAVIVFVGCLKTTVGLLTSFSETFAELFPKVDYKVFLAGTTLFPMLFANVGLSNIIAYSIPVLMFLYPLSIVLVALTFAKKFFGIKPEVFQWTMYFTVFAALIDGLNSAPAFFQTLGQPLIQFGQNYLPFFGIGMGWILPSVIGCLVGFVVSKVKK